MVAKGQDFAGYEPRGEQGMGLAYTTSPIVASHMRGDPAYFELLGVPTTIDPLTWEDKLHIVAKWQDLFAIIDAAGLCVFFSIRYLTDLKLDARPVGIMEFLNAATGVDYTLQELEKAGERIWNVERLFLTRTGFSHKDDSLPPRMIRELMPSGPSK
jgi:aldehyde:ferredoxin oxidoreductase